MVNALLVGLGGCIGSILRYGVSYLMKGALPGTFPWATLSINTAGCLLMGLAAGWLEKTGQLDSPLFYLMCVGILGGFTTYSTYGWETMQLLRAQQTTFALLNIAGNFGLGFLAVAAGRSLVT